MCQFSRKVNSKQRKVLTAILNYIDEPIPSLGSKYLHLTEGKGQFYLIDLSN